VSVALKAARLEGCQKWYIRRLPGINNHSPVPAGSHEIGKAKNLGL